MESLGSDRNLQVQIRVRIPDQPGSLGRFSRALGEAGADIVQVVVLERGDGWALDDFVVSGPGRRLRRYLPEILSEVPGIEVEGIWRTYSTPGTTPDTELLAQITADPGSGLAMLVGELPDLFNGEWAAAIDLAQDSVVCVSRDAPDPVDPAVLHLARSQAVTLADSTRTAVVPVGRADLVLVVIRGEAPAFHPVEISRLAMLAHVTATVTGLVTGPLTGALVGAANGATPRTSEMLLD